MVDLQYLAKLLTYGVSQNKAASAVGCSQGYVAQLLLDNEELKEEMRKCEGVAATYRVKKEEKLQYIERNLLRRVSSLVEETDSLGEAVGALHKITQIKSDQVLQHRDSGGADNVLQLNLGKLAQAKLQISMGQNKVIMHLGDTDMARAPAKVVKQMVEEEDEQRRVLEEEDEWGDVQASIGGV